MQIVCVQTFWSLFHLEFDPLAFLQCSVTFHINRREMDENVLLAIIRGYESVALGIVKPLYDTGRHNHSSKMSIQAEVLPSFPGSKNGGLPVGK